MQLEKEKVKATIRVKDMENAGTVANADILDENVLNI